MINHHVRILWNLLPVATALLLPRTVPGDQSRQPTIRAVDGAPGPTAQARDLLQERQRLDKEADRLSAEGKVGEAIQRVEKIVRINREILGPDHDDTAEALGWLAGLYAVNEDFVAARKAARDRLACSRARHSASDWRVADARLLLAYIERLGRCDAGQRRLLFEADKLSARLIELNRERRYTEALPLAEKILNNRHQVLGEEDAFTGDALQWLGGLYKAQGDWARAEGLLCRALDVRRKILGQENPRTVSTLHALGSLFVSRHEWSRAEKICREVLVLRRQTRGDKQADYAVAVDNLAWVLGERAGECESRGDFAAASQARREALELKTALRGSSHPEVTDARLALAHTQRLKEMTPEQRGRLAEAHQLFKLAAQLHEKGGSRQAIAPAEQALSIRRQVLGESDRLTGDALHNLAFYCSVAGEQARAQHLYEQALAVRRQVLGEHHPGYLVSLYNLGMVLSALGDDTRAQALDREGIAASTPGDDWSRDFQDQLATVLSKSAEHSLNQDDLPTAAKARQEILDIRRRLQGERHWQVTDARLAVTHVEHLKRLTPEERRQLRELAVLDGEVERLGQRNKTREAAALAERVVEGRRRLLGERDPVYADAVAELAWVYEGAEDYGKAQPLRRRALEIRREILGPLHPQVAVSVNNLGVVYRFLNQFDRAEPLYQEAVALHGQINGEKSVEYATALGNLGYLYVFEGHFERGEPLVRQSLAILRQALGENHADYGFALDDLGVLYRARGDFSHALPLLTQAVGVYRRAVREEKSRSGLTTRTGGHFGRCLNNLALLYKDAGEYAKAEPLYLEALALSKDLFGEKHRDYATDLDNLAALYHDMGNYAKAEELYRRAMTLREQVHGQKHDRYATSLNNLGTLYQDLGQFAKAEGCLRQALEIRKALLGDKHPDYALSLNNLAMLDVGMGEYAKAEPLFLEALAIRKAALGEKHPDYALSLGTLSFLYREKAEYPEAERLARQVLAIRKEVLGDQHPDTALALSALAEVYFHMGDFARAEPLYREARAIRRKILGERHHVYADSLLSLGKLQEARGEYQQAEKIYREALAIQNEVGGDHHPDYAAAETFLGNLYQHTGDYARAEPLLRQALEIRQALAPGKQYTPYAESLNNLATLYMHMGDDAKALAFLRRALEVTRRSVGENHPTYALYLSNLALAYSDMSELTRAEPLFRQALAVKEKTLGTKHPSVAVALNQLGIVEARQGHYAKALEHYRRSLAIHKAAHGRSNEAYITTLSNLAYTSLRSGDDTSAERMFRDVLALRREVLGEKNPDTAWTCQNLAMLYLGRRDYARALPLFRQAVQAVRQHREQVAAVQSERQQLATAELQRGILGHYLSAVVEAGAAGEEIYSEVLASKAEVSARQLLMRRARHPGQERESTPAARLMGELANATRRLASLTQAGPGSTDPGEHRRRLEELSNRIERLERDLAETSQDFRRQQALRRADPEQVKRALPTDAALVDFLVYSHYTPAPPKTGLGNWELRLAAFVLRPGRPIERIDLGPFQPIGQAVEAWRRQIGGKAAGKPDPAAALRRRVWQPLEKALEGTRLVLLSPDGNLARFPWPALPGKEPGTYLIEERAIGLVPIPQLLPDLLAQAAGNADQASLLVVGDVDFDATPGSSSRPRAGRAAITGERGAAAGSWSHLPGTVAEIDDVSAAFCRRFPGGRLAVLRGPRATEEAVRQEAGTHRYLHVATHGYFASPALRSALRAESAPLAEASDLFAQQDIAGFHPGLLSGLVLAGANRPVEPDRDDGILTALEVADLGLDGVELAVLSACETGLGDVAGGEGLLGLQRAFQTAGARAVVAGLWKVPDRATQALMSRFYENLWDKKLPKLEALRQAQLWLLHEGRRQPQFARGLETLVEDQAPGRPNSARLPPSFWAAFVLSGDWR